MKELIADLVLENRLPKEEHDRGWGRRRMRYPASERREITCGPNAVGHRHERLSVCHRTPGDVRRRAGSSRLMDRDITTRTNPGGSRIAVYRRAVAHSAMPYPAWPSASSKHVPSKPKVEVRMQPPARTGGLDAAVTGKRDPGIGRHHPTTGRRHEAITGSASRRIAVRFRSFRCRMPGPLNDQSRATPASDAVPTDGVRPSDRSAIGRIRLKAHRDRRTPFLISRILVRKQHSALGFNRQA